jgi:hypothetical protein
MKKRINEKNELMKKRSLIVEGEREDFKIPKFYLTEEEEEWKRDVNIGIIKLLTKYRAGLEGIIQQLSSNLENVEEFCKNPKVAGEEASKKIKDFLERLAADSKSTPAAVLEDLYGKFDGGLGKAIINIASPIVKKMDGAEVSKEIIDSIEELMRGEYGQGKINSLLSEIFQKLGVEVVPICK